MATRFTSKYSAPLRWYQRWIARPLSLIATLVMFCMMMLTLIDVVGRYLFATPVTGAFEVTELMLASVIFLGLPLVTSERNHIAVDIIDAFLSSRSVSRLKIIASLVGAFCFTLFAWMLWHHAFNLLRYGDTTAVLQIPYSWLSFLMAVAASLSALALCLIVIGDLADHLQSDEEK